MYKNKSIKFGLKQIKKRTICEEPVSQPIIIPTNNTITSTSNLPKKISTGNRKNSIKALHTINTTNSTSNLQINQIRCLEEMKIQILNYQNEIKKLKKVTILI